MAIRILVDSASDININEANELGISLIPIIVSFEDKQYYDGVNLLPHEFYDKLEASAELPKTAQINTYRYEQEYKKLTANNDQVIVISMSSKLSGTYRNAVKAAEKFENLVYVIDSLSATAGQRILCVHALKLIKEGKNVLEIVDELNQLKEKIVIFGVLDTLEYLKKGGRISPLVAVAGTILLIKPVIQVIDGEIVNVKKLRGSRKTLDYLGSKLEEYDIDLSMPHYIVWTGNDDTRTKEFINSNKYLINQQDKVVSRHPLGSTIGTHVGPGGIGIAFVKK